MAEIAMIHGMNNVNVPGMKETKKTGARGRIELVPTVATGEVIVIKGGIAVLARTGARADAAAAVAAERAAQEGRGLRR
jgi:hypothetical protein